MEKLQIQAFRNLQTITWEPGGQTNVIVGENAQGKTNLLEAIWLFTGGRSFRGAKDSELVRFGQEKALLDMTFSASDRQQTAQIIIDRRRHAVLNGLPLGTPAKLAGIFCGIVFSPAHLSLIRDGPDGRRRFLDGACCQLQPAYITVFSQFQRALSQRNALLKEKVPLSVSRSLLDVWNDRLARTGAAVIQTRRQYVEKLRPVATTIYDGIAGGREALSLLYQASGELPEKNEQETLRQLLLERLLENERADFAAGFTTVGPHRDDLIVEIDGRAARAFGSQGQQRSAVLALKLAEASLLKQETGQQPFALLDDVMSELDPLRQEYILQHVHGWQVFITCCDPAAVRRQSGAAEFHVKQGVLVPFSKG